MTLSERTLLLLDPTATSLHLSPIGATELKAPTGPTYELMTLHHSRLTLRRASYCPCYCFALPRFNILVQTFITYQDCWLQRSKLVIKSPAHVVSLVDTVIHHTVNSEAALFILIELRFAPIGSSDYKFHWCPRLLCLSTHLEQVKRSSLNSAGVIHFLHKPTLQFEKYGKSDLLILPYAQEASAPYWTSWEISHNERSISA